MICALSVNQILVICLILVLIAFVVVVAIMAKHAIELLKKSKKLVDDGQSMLEDTKKKADTTENKIMEAASNVARDTTPAVKAVATAACGITVINLLAMVGRKLTGRGGLFAAAADRKARKQARKEIKRSQRMIRKVNKQTALERKSMLKAKKMSRMAAKAEAKSVKTAAKAEARALRRVAKAEAKVAKKAALAEAKAARVAAMKAKKEKGKGFLHTVWTKIKNLLLGR